MKTSMLNKLRKRADDKFAEGVSVETHLGYDGSNAGQYVVQISNGNLISILDLIDEMGEALKHHQEQTRPIQRTMKALDKYKEMMG